MANNCSPILQLPNIVPDSAVKYSPKLAIFVKTDIHLIRIMQGCKLPHQPSFPTCRAPSRISGFRRGDFCHLTNFSIYDNLSINSFLFVVLRIFYHISTAAINSKWHFYARLPNPRPPTPLCSSALTHSSPEHFLTQRRGDTEYAEAFLIAFGKIKDH